MPLSSLGGRGWLGSQRPDRLKCKREFARNSQQGVSTDVGTEPWIPLKIHLDDYSDAYCSCYYLILFK